MFRWALSVVEKAHDRETFWMMTAGMSVVLAFPTGILIGWAVWG